MDLATILDDCVHRMRRGEGVEDCLADYPEQAAELAPMLHAASALQWLAGSRLPDAHRQQTRTGLRQVVAASQATPKRPPWMAFWVRPMARAFAGLAAVLVFLTFAINTVAASRPGDLAYPARVMAERSTLLLQRTPDGHVWASLRLADNRLSELEAGLALPGRAYYSALNALLQEDRGLANLTSHLPAPAREQVARQVAAHAWQLEALAQDNHEPQVANALRRAAVETNALADSIREHNEKAAPASDGPAPTLQATLAANTPAAMAPGKSVAVARVPAEAASAPNGQAAAGGLTARPLDGTVPARGTPTALPLQKRWGSSEHADPQSSSKAKAVPPGSGTDPDAGPKSPTAGPAPQNPGRTVPPAIGRAGRERPVSPPAIAPKAQAPRAVGPAGWDPDAGILSKKNGKTPVVPLQAQKGKQKGKATAMPTSTPSAGNSAH